MARALLSLVFLVFLVFQCFAQQEFVDKISQLIEAARARANVPCIAVGVRYKGQVLMSKGFGLSDVPSNTPCTDETLFQVASNTKHFTGILTLLAVQEGLLNLDSPVKNFFPNFATKDSYVNEAATLRDLLSHRHGLSRNDETWVFNPHREPEEWLQAMKYLDFDRPFRYGAGYNNFGFLVAGYVAASVFNMTFDQAIQQKIFDPLGMTSSYPLLKLVPGTAFANHLIATATGPNNETLTRWSLDGLPGSGSIVSNVKDFLKWSEFLLETSKGSTSNILSPSIFQEILTPNVASSTYTKHGQYTLGLWAEPFYRYDLYHHSGGLRGQRSHSGFIPGLDASVVLLTNQERYDPAILLCNIFEVLANETEPWVGCAIPNVPPSPAPQPPPSGTPHSLPLSGYVGEYNHPAYGSFRVDMNEAGQLTCSYGQGIVDGITETFLNGSLVHVNLDTFTCIFPSEEMEFGPIHFQTSFACSCAVAASRLAVDAATSTPIVWTNANYTQPGNVYQQPTYVIVSPAAAAPVPAPDEESESVELTASTMTQVVFLSGFVSACFTVILATIVFWCLRRSSAGGKPFTSV